MPTYTMEEFAKAFPQIAAEQVRAIGSGVQNAMARAALPVAKAIAPVGGVLSKDKQPGRLKRSLRSIETKRLEDPALVVSEGAPHAAIIDRGRKRSTKVKGKAKRSRAKNAPVVAKGKMLGSKQAPSGISRPTGRLVLPQGERIAAQVIADIERAAT